MKLPFVARSLPSVILTLSLQVLAKRFTVVALGLILGLLPARLVRGSDRWESGYAGFDNNSTTLNELRHGVPQVAHDVEAVPVGTPDQDWMMVAAQARHSYEAVVSGGTMPWGCGVDCPAFDRVTFDGIVLTPGVPDGPMSNSGLVAREAVRWIAPATETDFLRVAAGTFMPFTVVDQYDAELYDTTYFLPRFNNSSTQITVFVVQNTTSGAVSGSIYFYDAGGNLLNTHPLSLPAQGQLVLNTATILPGVGGSATIAQTGGYGALAGKAVAVEPATGFTFDTLLTPVPR